MKITKNEFGMTKDNQPISLYTIENASGASVTLSDYGCRIIKIMVPNKEGKLTDVILGLMNADEYLADDASLGAVVGRCANRIAKGHFTLNDKEYNLAKFVFCNFHLETPFHNILVNILIMPHLGLHSK